MKKTIIISALLAVAVFAGTFAASQLEAQPAVKSTVKSSVATCNVLEIFENYKKAKDLFANYSNQDKELMTERKKRMEKIENLSNMLKGLNPGSPEFETQQSELQRQQINLEAWLKWKTTTISTKRSQLTKQMYSDMQHAIARIAKQKGFTLVMFNYEGPLMSQDPKRMISEITQRKVLFADTSIDITADVLSDMNKKYSAGK